MKSAYNDSELYHLAVLKESKRWWKKGFITDTQLAAIREAYKSIFYHPNFTIRILLFVATLIALSGVTGFGFLFISAIGEQGLSVAAVVYGIACFFFLKKVLIEKNHHYKSGVTEAMLYHSCAYTLGGLAALTDINPHLMLILSVIVFAYMSFRFLDLISTIAAVLALAGLVFFEFYNMGGVFQQIIPFVFIIFFTPIYWISHRLKLQIEHKIWKYNLVVVESASLILIYLAGNYLVVRELSVHLMGLDLEPGQDIPFAMVFYGLTVLLPVAYLFFGIRNKDVVLLRVSLLLLAFSVFTFKYYYGFGHPEITLTVAGGFLLLVSLALFNYLKTIRSGFTRENLLAEKWGDPAVQAFVISQTLGGNQITPDDPATPGGGEFGGGGSSGSF